MKLVQNRFKDQYLCFNKLCPMIKYGDDHKNPEKCPDCNKTSVGPKSFYWRLEE